LSLTGLGGGRAALCKKPRQDAYRALTIAADDADDDNETEMRLAGNHDDSASEHSSGSQHLARHNNSGRLEFAVGPVFHRNTAEPNNTINNNSRRGEVRGTPFGLPSLSRGGHYDDDDDDDDLMLG
jgi:hypothetical protein